MNDVHLPRFGGTAGVRALPLDANPDMPPYTELPPASKMPYGDSKDFSPSNAWNDSKTAVLRQLPAPAWKHKFRTGLQIRRGIPSDFLGLHPAQDIMDEFLLTTEEPSFTRSKPSLGFELQFQ